MSILITNAAVHNFNLKTYQLPDTKVVFTPDSQGDSVHVGNEIASLLYFHMVWFACTLPLVKRTKPHICGNVIPNIRDIEEDKAGNQFPSAGLYAT